MLRFPRTLGNIQKFYIVLLYIFVFKVVTKFAEMNNDSYEKSIVIVIFDLCRSYISNKNKLCK